MRNAYYNNSFKQDWFHTYYRHVEEYFQCTGFCSLTYNSSMTGTSMKIVKYLFSDVTKGIPKHFGCLDRILDWLFKTLNALGAVCLFMFVVEVILFIIVILLLGIMNEENKAEADSKKKEEKGIEMEELQRLREKERQEAFEKQRKEKEENEKKKLEEKKEDAIPETSFRPNESQAEENTIEFMPSAYK